MADRIMMKVEGLAELERKMHQLGQKLGRRALRASTNAGIQVIKKEARSLAPVRTGRLSKKAIYVKRSRRQSSATRETYILGVRLGRKEQQKGRDAFYWFYLEFGTIKMAARPFLRPAFEKKKYEAIEKFKEKMRERLRQLVPGA